VSGLRPCIERQPANTSKIPVRRLRLRKSRRCRWRDQYFRAGIPLVSLWRVGAVRPLDEAGTHRSDSQLIAQRRRNPRPLGRGGCQDKENIAYKMHVSTVISIEICLIEKYFLINFDDVPVQIFGMAPLVLMTKQTKRAFLWNLLDN